MTRPLEIGAFVLSMLAAACGSSVQTPNSGGGGSGGSVPICTAEAFPCCEPGQDDPCCTECYPTTKVCGPGIGGCASDEYCDFPDDTCGAQGVCAKKPLGCDSFYQPTCGCDGQVHGNGCEAASAGADVASTGGCVSPMGMFACGAIFCELGAEYCKEEYPAVSGVPLIHSCKPLPEACAMMPYCSCLLDEPCGSEWVCDVTSEGGLMLSCDDL